MRQTIWLCVEDGGCIDTLPCHAHHCRHTAFYFATSRALTVLWALPSLNTLPSPTTKLFNLWKFFGCPPPLFTARVRDECSFMFECKLFWQSVSPISKILIFLPRHPPCMSDLCSHSARDVFVLAFYLGQINEEKLNHWSWLFTLVINIMQPAEREISWENSAREIIYFRCPHSVLSLEIFSNFGKNI